MDRSEKVKLFLSVFFGAWVGGLIAREVSHPLWWVGPFAGAGLAYMLGELEELAAAFRHAWRSVTSWKPNGEWWKNVSLSCVLNVVNGFSMSAVIAPPLLLLFLFTGGFPIIRQLPVFVPLMVYLCLAVGAVIFSFLFYGIWRSYEERENLTRNHCKMSDLMFTITFCNPFVVYFYFLPIGIWQLIKLFSRGCVMLVALLLVCLHRVPTFLKIFFTFIHSERRLMRAVYAFTGATVGYLFGNALAGAVIGAALVVVFGVEVIATRILHVRVR